ncbi:MAG: GGDEF domain-containing protein [Lachnospiraceae bacterium]|nr:GGDEF domain-containing protein [Lachnospiraceae bacterium]
MQHKNIAVLMTAIDTDDQSDILRGIEESAKFHGCNVAVFLWFTGAFEKEKHNLGEINIVNLPDLNLFDGVIVVANAMHLEENRKKIEDILENVECPVVCLGFSLKDYPSVFTDGYSGMRALVEHIIKDHGKRKIHFVKGIEGNADAEARYKAYTDVLTENKIPIVPGRISQGDFYITGAATAAKEILKSSLSFPEAIVCANDIMAITIADILMDKGIRIPEDILIAGYDCSLEGQVHNPKIASVRTCCRELGETAGNVLLSKIEGNVVEQVTYLPDELVKNESCSCKNEILLKEQEYRNGAVGTENERRKMLHQMIMLEKHLIEGSTFEEWRNCIKEFISAINPPEFYICANEGFIEDIFERGMMEQEDMSTEERLAYSSTIDVILAYQNGMFKNHASFASQQAFDDLFHDTECGKLYIFSPLHYLERNFGYFVFVDSTFTIGNQLYMSWLINMGNAIENIRKQSMLRNAMKRLDDMYIRDSLTGVYNRFGMERYFMELKKKCLMTNSSMQISFVDVDGLKKINDRCGHEEGDLIIKTAANILQKKAGKSYVIRYGGDEFVVMGMTKSEKEVETYWQHVNEEIEKYNSHHKKQAELSMSYGYDVFKMDVNTFLEDCIRVTDKKMYIAKNRKKQQRQE